MHHLQEVQGMSLRGCEYLVFDEADRLFEMGFAEQLKQVRLFAGNNENFLAGSESFGTPCSAIEFCNGVHIQPEAGIPARSCGQLAYCKEAQSAEPL
jgi:ATP-dependent RNA helicase DDX54/DBP10